VTELVQPIVLLRSGSHEDAIRSGWDDADAGEMDGSPLRSVALR
jgi:hypothetical protein